MRWARGRGGDEMGKMKTRIGDVQEEEEGDRRGRKRGIE